MGGEDIRQSFIPLVWSLRCYIYSEDIAIYFSAVGIAAFRYRLYKGCYATALCLLQIFYLTLGVQYSKEERLLVRVSSRNWMSGVLRGWLQLVMPSNTFTRQYKLYQNSCQVPTPKWEFFTGHRFWNNDSDPTLTSRNSMHYSRNGQPVRAQETNLRLCWPQRAALNNWTHRRYHL